MPRSGAGAIRNSLAAAGALALVLDAAPALAQAFQCRVPGRASVPRIVPDAPPRRMAVTGYTLALSWAPEFCRTRQDDAAHARQCSGRAGRFGLVVHGLWPDGAQGWPQWCRATRPGAAELAANLCVSPSERLLARQWAKHGSCMARRPATYFKVTRILWQGLRIPELPAWSRDPRLTAGDVRARFAAANPGWRSEAIGVRVNRRGWLEELRLCYDRRFMPTRCDRQRLGARDGEPVKIWRGL